MVAVDTNILVRWLVRDDRLLADKADAIIYKAKASSLLLDRLILAEFSYVLKSVYKMTKPEIVLNLRILFSTSCFSIIDRVLVEQMVENYANETPLSIEDAWLLTLKQNGKVAGVASFDDSLQQRLQ
jgi:predicted nucleic acid-binding protein